MALSSIVNLLQNSTLTKELVDRCQRNERLTILGGERSAKALVTSALAKNTSKSLLIIVPTLEDATRWLSLIESMGWDNSLIYPTSEGSPYEGNNITSEITWGQLQVLSELILDNMNNSNRRAIIATERALQPHLPPYDEFKSNCKSIKKGDCIELKKLERLFSTLGYERTNLTNQEGTWSRRGDIIDIYPVSSELPIRLEFFGDEIDKLREFDPVSQRSEDSVKEFLLTPSNFNSIIAKHLKATLPEAIEIMLSSENLELLLDENIPNEVDKLIGLAWERPANLLDYLNKETCIAIDEFELCRSHSNKWEEHAQESYNDLVTKNQKLVDIFPKNLHMSFHEIVQETDKFFGFYLSDISSGKEYQNYFNLSSSYVQLPPNQFGKIASKVRGLQKEKQRIWIISAQPSRAVALLDEHECFAKFVPNTNDYNSINQLVEENIPVTLKAKNTSELKGLQLPPWKIVLITDKEFFGQYSLNSTGYIRRRRVSNSSKINPSKIQAGDYVVHRNHGIGEFQQIEKLAMGGELRDYLVVKYLDGTLRVAADQLGSLGRYRSSGGKAPQVNKLGGSTWEKIKSKARKVVQKVAIDLIKLYAERTQSLGHAFPIDGPWQKELEDSFQYEATPDQLTAVNEVKKDMEKEFPMDRLVCGDVGFGKTEVAIRAIFKAVTAGKQVAILAPTTVLAQQHWRTISDRFAPYPIKIGLLNRFRSTSEKKILLTGLKEGTTDVVIGTHQLLNKQVKFKNIGLLVIDEEQRFGVNQKEKMKALKKDIDVLTLTATPIPRTLYMSLSGVREMSLITTPPPGRRPIKTHLSVYDNETIRSAICQEIDRGGQIFYVVPRVDGIEEVSNRLKGMLPNLKVLIAHGQMEEGDLENVMVAFNAGEAELMLCTTIIESGLDIPRVNTILIEDSHRFGLSQLYQLRGRVGRSGTQAHAWLFYPQELSLSDSSQKRLKAIQEFSQLGSGYQLAMRDMEIRGVGNILGVEQSGKMETVGFDLYMEMLQEYLSELTGQTIPKVEDTQIDLKVTAFIPVDWISDNGEKIAAYKSASECNTEEELIDLALIWSDRYGSIPVPVSTLLEIMKLKIKSRNCGISRISQQSQNLLLETTMDEAAFRMLRKGLEEHLQGRIIFKKGSTGISTIVARGLGALDIESQISQLSRWLTKMQSQIPDSEGYTGEQVIKKQIEKDKNVISI